MNTYTEFARAGIEKLQEWFNPTTGLWDSTGWWNAANILWVVLDYAARSQNSRYCEIASHVFEKHQKGNFLNDYYDDEGWWALTWIKAYALIGDQRYLSMARTIFADMCTGWDVQCGGGIWWKKERRYKNAIANELFISTSARLSRYVTDTREQTVYLDWALRGWHWFEQSGMINSASLINDGLDDMCHNNGGVTWSYNQGVIIGGLVDLSAATQNPAYMHTAEAIADAAITALTDTNGILHEPCEPNCGIDGPQFKGIFIRNLAYLYVENQREEYRQCIVRNANSIVQQSQVDYRFGLNWSGPADSADAARQSSALDAINVTMSLLEVAHA
jgi:predicted alpha-1,6-mannanase (GH76 family)